MRPVFARTIQLFTVAFADYFFGFFGLVVFGFLTCFIWSLSDSNSKSALWTSLGAGIWTLVLCLPPAMGSGQTIVTKTASAFGLPCGIILVFLTLLYVMALSASAGLAGAQFGRLLAGRLKHDR